MSTILTVDGDIPDVSYSLMHLLAWTNGQALPMNHKADDSTMTLFPGRDMTALSKISSIPLAP
jgi:hypothetical protein